MSKRVLILVEGQTEERFVKDVLAPAFVEQQLYFFPTLLVTKHVKDGPRFKGGVTSFARFTNDLRRLLPAPKETLVTTLLDYYGLPTDFPGMATRPPSGKPAARAVHVENSIFDHFGSPSNFVPFLLVHEFEALLFSSAVELPRVVNQPKQQEAFAKIRGGFTTPEDINDHPDTAPSKRILGLFPSFKKTLHGPTTALRIGLNTIRSECPHFNQWISRIEVFART